MLGPDNTIANSVAGLCLVRVTRTLQDYSILGSGATATMAAYELEGTPSLVLIDKLGRVRLRHLGQIDDLRLGAILGQLISEPYEADAE